MAASSLLALASLESLSEKDTPWALSPEWALVICPWSCPMD